jgi:hypothetical protein
LVKIPDFSSLFIAVSFKLRLFLMMILTKTCQAIGFTMVLLSLFGCSYRQIHWNKKTFFIACKESEKKYRSVKLNGLNYNYCFSAKEYIDTNPDGTHNFEGIVLLDINKTTTDSLTASKICSLISQKIKLQKFIVFMTCEARKIYRSSTGPKNESEKKYLTENYFGTYVQPKKPTTSPMAF